MENFIFLCSVTVIAEEFYKAIITVEWVTDEKH